MNKRIDWLDAAKGLGMVLVMLGHADIPNPLRTYIYTFHMPFFFFLSGYLFSLTRFPNFKVFLFKMTKSLIFPYLFFSLVAYIWFVFIVKFGQVSYNHNLLMPLLGSIIATRKTFWTVDSGTLWFVNCLLCTELLFYLITKVGKTKKVIGIVLILFSILGCFYNKMVGKPLPWSIDISMISVGFYGAGYLFKEYRGKFERFVNIKTFVFLIAINITTGYINYVHSGARVDFYNSSLGNIFLFYLSAFSGIGAFVILTKLFKINKGLKYIGKNSFIYLALHQNIVFFLFNLFIQKTGLNSEKILEIPLLKGSLYTLVAAFFLVPAVYLINHHLPFILGKTKNQTKRKLSMKVS